MTLRSWLLGTPIFFAITSFMLMVLVTIIAGLFLPDTASTLTTIGVLISISTLLSAILALRRLSGHKMDRLSFINIHNAQSFIIIGASFLSLIMATYLMSIKFWLFTMLQTKSGAILSIILAIVMVFVSLYITGIALCNFWAKFWRGIDMKIPAWKIILSIPFGFSMTWIPGYFIPNKDIKNATVPANYAWYKKLSNWVMSSPRNTGIMFCTLVLLSGLATGLSSVLLTFTFAMLFSIWVLQIGAKKFEKNIGGTYSTIAVIINIIMIAYTLINTHTVQ